MRLRGSFERRLTWVVVLFALVPTLLVLTLATYLLSQAVSLSGPAAAWERVAESGRPLLDLAAASGDAEARLLAERHAQELSTSLVQARRWQFLVDRALTGIPLLALGLAIVIGSLAVTASRGIARGLSRPVGELVEWARRLGRGEPLPARDREEESGVREFALLRRAFRETERELDASRRAALEAERMRAWVTFARGVAHEIKNPLTPMRLAVGGLRRAGAEGESLEVLEEEMQRLDDLARSFAQLGRAPEGAPSEVELEELLRSLLRTHLPAGVRAEVLVAPGASSTVHGHLDALTRAFANLVLNAAEAMQGSGELRVRIASRQDQVEVRVEDTGPGIPEGQLERIFEPDFTTRARGTGLGLALVRQAARHHGGEVRAEPRREGGTVFVVTLPRVPVETAAVPNA
jgi:signal transduction histidine kinase